MALRPRLFAPTLLVTAAFSLLIGCEKQETSDWNEASPPPSSSTTIDPSPPSPPDSEKDSPKDEQSAALTTEERPAEPSAKGAPGVRFMAYNLENYLDMRRTVNGERTIRSKPEDEIRALIEIIAAEKPDILGVCEIGLEKDLLDLQERLKKAGVDLPHTHHLGGWDNTRHLAILSKFPILENHSRGDLTFQQEGSTYQINRGILDVSIDPGTGPIRFIGLHLKSKREVDRYSQELMRQNEALLVRAHCDQIVKQDPQARILVYGDMNDTRRTPAISNIKGNGNSSSFLEDIPLTDSDGQLWTHFWSYQHVYSRFDYVFVSRSLKPLVDLEHSYLVDPPSWGEASDHRALLLTLKDQRSANRSSAE